MIYQGEERRKVNRRKPGRRTSDDTPEQFTTDRRREYRAKILERYPIDLDLMAKEQNSLERIREEKLDHAEEEAYMERRENI